MIYKCFLESRKATLFVKGVAHDMTQLAVCNRADMHRDIHC